MKRFRVKNVKRDFAFSADTTLEIFQWLGKQDMGLNSFTVECVVDDIEVDADDFMKAFNEGERPMDLQFF